jgi:hypothetical protein
MLLVGARAAAADVLKRERKGPEKMLIVDVR